MNHRTRIAGARAAETTARSASKKDWLGGTFGAFVAGLVSIPLAGAPQVIVRELWQATASKKADPGGRSLAGVSLM